MVKPTSVVVEFALVEPKVPWVNGNVKLVIVGDTPPTTVKEEQVTPPEQEALEVPTLATVVPLPPP